MDVRERWAVVARCPINGWVYVWREIGCRTEGVRVQMAIYLERDSADVDMEVTQSWIEMKGFA